MNGHYGRRPRHGQTLRSEERVIETGKKAAFSSDEAQRAIAKDEGGVLGSGKAVYLTVYRAAVIVLDRVEIGNNTIAGFTLRKVAVVVLTEATVKVIGLGVVKGGRIGVGLIACVF